MLARAHSLPWFTSVTLAKPLCSIATEGLFVFLFFFLTGGKQFREKPLVK